MKYCSYCGAPMEDMQLRCPNCNSLQDETSTGFLGSSKGFDAVQARPEHQPMFFFQSKKRDGSYTGYTENFLSACTAWLIFALSTVPCLTNAEGQSLLIFSLGVDQDSFMNVIVIIMMTLQILIYPFMIAFIKGSIVKRKIRIFTALVSSLALILMIIYFMRFIYPSSESHLQLNGTGYLLGAVLIVNMIVNWHLCYQPRNLYNPAGRIPL